MTHISAEQRYRQAMVKQRIVIQRRVRDFMAGVTDVLECTDVRMFMIDALERAYQAGRRESTAEKADLGEVAAFVGAALIVGQLLFWAQVFA